MGHEKGGQNMKLLLSMGIGYLLGALNPAALLSKMKKQDFRNEGTGNLGASNALILLGKGYGVLVMLFDIVKAYVAVKIAQLLCPSVAVAGALGGLCAVVGHVYPFYMKFKGGKGLASFGGMILGLDPLMFLVLLMLTFVLIVIINHSAAMPFTAGVLFPVLYGLKSGNIWGALIALSASLLIMCTHFGNLKKALSGEDMKIRDIIKKFIFKKGA